MLWLSVLIGLGAMALAIYKRCIQAPLCYDDLAVLSQPAIQKCDWRYLIKHSVRSVVTLTYALNYKLSKQLELKDGLQAKTAHFHLTNIVFHALNAGLIGLLLSRLGLTIWPGLLFMLVTPLATNAVANIAGRFSVISTTFLLLSLLSGVMGFYVLCVLCVVLALLSKLDTITLPLMVGLVLLLLGDWWWWLYIVLPVAAVAVAWWKFNVMRHLLQSSQAVINPTTGWPPMLEGWAFRRSFIVESVRLWPQWLLGFGYSISPHSKEYSWRSFYVALGVLLMVILSVLLFAPLMIKIGFLIWLLSPWWLYLLKPMPDIILEHRAYASIVGLAIIVSFLSSFLPVPIMTAWLTMLAMKTHERAGFWTPTRLFEEAIRDGSRKPMILLNQSSILLQQGRIKEAEALILSALEIAPNVYHAWGNLATIYAMKQNGPAMLACYRRGAYRCPKMPLAWAILGQAYEGQRRTARALAAYRKALSLESLENRDEIQQMYDTLRAQVVV